MKALTILFCVMIFTVGCYQQKDARVNVGEGIRSDTIESNIITRPIGAAVSILIGEGIEIREVKTARNGAGFLQVQVSGYNHSTQTQRFEYRAEWLDNEGVGIDTAVSTWLPVSALRKSEFRFSATAPTPKAVDFRIVTRKK